MEANNHTLSNVVRRLRGRLAPKYGEHEASAMVNEIFRNLKGWDAVQMAIRIDDEISDFIIGEADKVVDRLLNDEPIQHIFQTAHFYGMDLRVTPATLIPRPETATLVDMIIDENRHPDLRVLDLGTGSGCIAIALARNLPFAKVTAVDISTEALDIAKENATKLKAKIDFINSDMLSASFRQEFDIIVSNPPYIAMKEAETMEDNVLLHEPASALFVPDDDPLKFYKAIARIARESLAHAGRIYLEINPIYSRQLADMLRRNGFTETEILKDIEGRDRFITAKR